MKKILIVEDEVLIATLLEHNLLKFGYEVIGVAIDYEEAVYLMKQHKPDIALLDIRINGTKTGIELAAYINEFIHIPFLFLTSHSDNYTLQQAMETDPAGYLVKPIQYATLHTTITTAFNNYKSKNSQNIQKLQKGKTSVYFDLDKVIYIKAENVYLELHTTEGKTLHRATLTTFLEEINNPNILRVNRSYAVNKKYITKQSPSTITLGNVEIKTSKNYL